MKKKVYILFMSHKSGDHGLSVHDTREDLIEELKSVVESIKENHANTDEREINEDYQNDLAAIEGAACDGYWAELSDTTWFDVFERTIEFKEQKMGGFGKHPSML